MTMGGILFRTSTLDFFFNSFPGASSLHAVHFWREMARCIYYRRPQLTAPCKCGAGQTELLFLHMGAFPKGIGMNEASDRRWLDAS